MFVILSYDINQKRVGKAMKICRKYLAHVQRSVFEGTITEGKLKALKKELENIVDAKVDSICIYEMESVKYAGKEQIGVIQNFSNII